MAGWSLPEREGSGLPRVGTGPERRAVAYARNSVNARRALLCGAHGPALAIFGAGVLLRANVLQFLRRLSPLASFCLLGHGASSIRFRLNYA